METAEKDTKGLQEFHPHRVLIVNGGKKAATGQKSFVRSQQRNNPECYCCGAKHKASDCKFHDAKCHYCKNKGHLAKVCKSKQRAQAGQKPYSKAFQLQIPISDTGTNPEYPNSMFHTHGCKKTPPILVSLNINGADVTMELDTGATL